MNSKKLGQNLKPKSEILIVDDHAVVRQGLRRLIETEPTFEVCAEATNGAEALALLKKIKPNIVIVDLGLEGMSGLELIKNIQLRTPKLPILVISMYDEAIYAERILKAGAKGYLMKKESAEKVIPAIRHVLSGKVYVSDKIAEKILSNLGKIQSDSSASPVAILSDRELEVFQLIGQGFKSSQIADKLNLSVKTVESYREQIKIKLKLENASALSQYAIQWTHAPL
jgi:DNA-binding NarL/FixJ family response regulator